MTDPETMRERMARALFEHRRPHPQAEWGDMPPPMQESHRIAADAILDVLAEPTIEMLRAGDNVILADEQLHSGPYSMLEAEWRAMIEAIRSGA